MLFCFSTTNKYICHIHTSTHIYVKNLEPLFLDGIKIKQ